MFLLQIRVVACVKSSDPNISHSHDVYLLCEGLSTYWHYFYISGSFLGNVEVPFGAESISVELSGYK